VVCIPNSSAVANSHPSLLSKEGLNLLFHAKVKSSVSKKSAKKASRKINEHLLLQAVRSHREHYES